MPSMRAADSNLDTVCRILSAEDSVVVAYSGGVDSTLLATLAWRTLGPRRCRVVLANSPLLASGERDAACQLAKTCGFPLTLIRHAGFDRLDVRANPPERCYLCKRALFEQMQAAYPDTTILHGLNLDDLDDERPGNRAAEELGIRAPLAEAGLTKAAIYDIAGVLELPNAHKPALPCLATRLAFGVALSDDHLALIDACEQAVTALCATIPGMPHDERTAVRVRSDGTVLSLELDGSSLGALDESDRSALVTAVHEVATRMNARHGTSFAVDGRIRRYGGQGKVQEETLSGTH